MGRCRALAGGHTGRRKLQELFECIGATGDRGIDRDALIDALWPDSDGDRALRNLHAALNDVRRILRDVPLVRLERQVRRYRLLYFSQRAKEAPKLPAS